MFIRYPPTETSMPSKSDSARANGAKSRGPTSAENGRIYIPQEDIEHFNADLSKYNPQFIALLSFEADRAHKYYNESRPLIKMVSRRSRASLWALIEIYRRLLSRIERSNYDVLAKRIRVPTWEKLAILARAVLRADT